MSESVRDSLNVYEERQELTDGGEGRLGDGDARDRRRERWSLDRLF